MKANVTIYISDELVRRCKQLNIPLSATIERLLELIVEDPNLTDEEFQLVMLTEQAKFTKAEIHRLEMTLHPLRNRLEFLNKAIENQLVLVEEVKRSRRIAVLMKVLNVKIRQADYQIAKVKETASTELEELRKLGIPVGDDWLAKQIGRLE